MTKTQPRPAISNPLLYFRSTVVVVVVVVVSLSRNISRQVQRVGSSRATESRRLVAKGRSGVWRDALPLRADMFAVRKQSIPLCAHRVAAVVGAAAVLLLVVVVVLATASSAL